MNARFLCMYVIFRSPDDYPGRYVVRRQTILPGKVVPDPEPWHVGDSLREARLSLPPDACVCFERHPDDVLSIVETWC